jgi:hypothetical protein
MTRPNYGKRRARFILPGLYLLFAIYGWIDFARTNPDGLANLGLFAITLPVTALGLLISSLAGSSAMIMPSGHGYLGNHALYYVPAVALTATLWWLFGRAIDRHRS